LAVVTLKNISHRAADSGVAEKTNTNEEWVYKANRVNI